MNKDDLQTFFCIESLTATVDTIPNLLSRLQNVGEPLAILHHTATTLRRTRSRTRTFNPFTVGTWAKIPSSSSTWSAKLTISKYPRPEFTSINVRKQCCNAWVTLWVRRSLSGRLDR